MKRLAVALLVAWLAISVAHWMLDLARGWLFVAAIITTILLMVGAGRTGRRDRGRDDMWKTVKRGWKYLAVKLRVWHDENADPKVLLEQAILEAREQHKRLTEQAGNVIANQKQAQARLDRTMSEYEKATASVRQALMLADQEGQAGNAEQAAKFEDAAEAFAGRLSDLERQIADMERQLLQATSAAENAKAAVAQNVASLRKKLAEREQLLSTIDQAKMQEAMNRAAAQISATIGDDVPTLGEVRHKIDLRLARARAMSELGGLQTNASIDARILEIERAQVTAEARARLSMIRAELGLAMPRLGLPEGRLADAANGGVQ